MKAFGANRAKRLGVRLSAMLAALNLEALRNVPGRIHELKGDRRGQFAADLDGPFRLIFEPVLSEKERKDYVGGFNWSLITHVRVLDVENYHGA